jgi:hypothetical protein
MAAKRVSLLLLSVAPLVVGIACYGPTQMTVEVQTDLRCAEQLRAALYVGGGGEAIGETGDSECTPLDGATSTLGDLVLAPGGERTASVTVKVKLGVGVDAQGNRVDAKRCEQGAPGCVLASRRFAYAEHEQKRIVVRLYRDCLGKVCPDGQTCVQGGACVSEQVQCEGDSCAVFEERPFALGDGGVEAGQGDSATDAAVKCVGPAGNGVLATAATVPADVAASATAMYWHEANAPGVQKIDFATLTTSFAVGSALSKLETPIYGFALEGDAVWYAKDPPGPYTGRRVFGPAGAFNIGDVGVTAMSFAPARASVFVGADPSGILEVSAKGVAPFSSSLVKRLGYTDRSLLYEDATGTLTEIPFLNGQGEVVLAAGVSAWFAEPGGAFLAAQEVTKTFGIFSWGAVGPLALVVGDRSPVTAIGVDASRVYWAEDSGSGSTIKSLPRPGGLPTLETPVASAPRVRHLFVDPGGECLFFWAEVPGGAELRSAPKAPAP